MFLCARSAVCGVGEMPSGKPAANWRKRPNPQPVLGVQAYLTVADYPAAFAFYRAAFGAEERLVLRSNGHVDHAELALPEIGPLQLCEASPQLGRNDVSHFDAELPITLYCYSSDCEGVYADALANGATGVQPPTLYRYNGTQMCVFTDPLGVRWTVVTRKEALDPAECQRRYAEEIAKLTRDKHDKRAHKEKRDKRDASRDKAASHGAGKKEASREE